MSRLVLCALLICAALPARGERDVVERARVLYSDLEVDAAIALLEPHVERDATSAALELLARCYAVIGRLVDAQARFSEALALDPTLDLPSDTPPKILMVFQRAQAERDRVLDDERERARAELIASIALAPQFPLEAVGGAPLKLEVQVRDPQGAVRGARVMYRAAKEPASSALALEQGERGRWSSALPGEISVNDEGLVVELVAELIDEAGERLVAAPAHRVHFSPGQVETPLLESPVFWITTSVLSAVVVAGGAAALIALNRPRGDLPPYRFPE